MNLPFMKRSLAQSVNSLSPERRVATSYSLGYGMDERATICSEIVNSNLSVARESNEVSSWMLRMMILLVVVLNGSMRIAAFPVTSPTTPKESNQEMLNPLMILLQDRNNLEVVPGDCYITSVNFDDDSVQIFISCDEKVCENEEYSDIENIDLEPLITKVWNMIIIGVDKEIRQSLLDYLISGECIQFNVDLVSSISFQDGILTALVPCNREYTFSFKIFPDKHVERVEPYREVKVRDVEELLIDEGIDEDVLLRGTVGK